jgi:hypothetical protein
MKKHFLFAAGLAALGATTMASAGESPANFGVKQALLPGFGNRVLAGEKAASAGTLGARAVSNNAETVFGGFQLTQQATVYILVRGNSLGSLGITQNYLDSPHLRVYNQAGQDIYSQNGFNGFNGCTTTNDAAVVNYYAAQNIPVATEDACLADVFPAGVYTFTVTPSIAGQTSPINSLRTGEILFEVKLGP